MFGVTDGKAYKEGLENLFIKEIEAQEMAGYSLDRRDSNGRTLLIRAAEKGYGRAVDILLSKRVKGLFELFRQLFRPLVDMKDDTGSTALMYAVRSNDVKMVRALIDKGAKLDIRDKDGKTALIHAIERGNSEVVELLFENGANPDIADKDHKKPWMYAIDHANRTGDTSAFRLLVIHHALINKKAFEKYRKSQEILNIVKNKQKIREDYCTPERKYECYKKSVIEEKKDGSLSFLTSFLVLSLVAIGGSSIRFFNEANDYLKEKFPEERTEKRPVRYRGMGLRSLFNDRQRY